MKFGSECRNLLWDRTIIEGVQQRMGAIVAKEEMGVDF
jgi:hypothetical protein